MLDDLLELVLLLETLILVSVILTLIWLQHTEAIIQARIIIIIGVLQLAALQLLLIQTDTELTASEVTLEPVVSE